MNSPRTFALPVLPLGAVGIGFAPIFVRLSEIGPVATAFYRLLFAVPILWIWAQVDSRNALPPVPAKRLKSHQSAYHSII